MTADGGGALTAERVPESVAARLKKELKKLAILLAAGLLYALWLHFTHLGIPCPFNTLLHIKCPGCGMTHAAMAVLKTDFYEAWESNALSLTVVPLLILILTVYEVRYIRTGKRHFNPAEKILLGVMAYTSLAYAIVRNLGIMS